MLAPRAILAATSENAEARNRIGSGPLAKDFVDLSTSVNRNVTVPVGCLLDLPTVLRLGAVGGDVEGGTHLEHPRSAERAQAFDHDPNRHRLN